MKSLYKYLVTLIAIVLVAVITLYDKKGTASKQVPYSSTETVSVSSTEDTEQNIKSSSAVPIRSESSYSRQLTEAPTKHSEMIEAEIATLRIEKKHEQSIEEELVRKKLALVKKYSSQLPTIYNNQKYSGKNVVGSPLDYMKKIADTGDTAAKLTYASALTRDFWHDRFDIKPEEVEQWKLRFKEPFNYFRSAAIDGDAWAASCLGCEYFLPPYSDNLEGLTWVLISVKLGRLPCIDRMPSDEKLYAQALEQAKFYLDYYKFKTEN
jgi:predicted Holliday junction resolvase-like endonuclease